MKSTAVRVSYETRQKLKLLADQTGETMQSTVDKAVEAYRRQLFLERANHAFANLRRDPQAWREEEAERLAWDETVADGLEGS